MILEKRSALQFIVLLGIVSLFSDVTYEGARSISGPYLALLGASGMAVGIVSGLGELMGYGLRLISGYFSDRSHRYWTFTILGYAINLLAVPLLALAHHWEVAAALLILERSGKALRSPSRDAMLSYATTQVGRGRGFGLHEALDQIGAISGPIIVSVILAMRDRSTNGTASEIHAGYAMSFAALLIPALLALLTLATARFLFPRPGDLEPVTPQLQSHGFPKNYWLYLMATSLIAFGFADFSLVAFHFQRASVVAPAWIPLLYAMAMAVDAVSALLFGLLYDRYGMRILMIAAILSAFFAPLVFLGGLSMAAAGMVLWGIGMGAQESILRAAIADMVPPNRRGTAYGLFNLGFGLSWFAGSAAMGTLYDHSLLAVVWLSVLAQLTSIPVFLAIRKQSGPSTPARAGTAQ